MSGVCCVVLAIRLLSTTLAGSRDRRADASLEFANFNPSWGYRMTRIAIIDRADMNAEQARVYDAAKQTTGIVGGPYLAYIRLPKVFEACQDLRATLAAGPLSRREQPIIDAINARKTPSLADARERTCFAVAKEILANKGLSDDSYAAAEKVMGLESLVALVAAVGSFSMTCLTAATFQIDPPPNNPTPLTE